MRKAWVIWSVAMVLVFISVTAQEKVLWKPNLQLEWKDFKGKPDTTSFYAAITSSGISFSYQLETTNGSTELATEVNAYFYPKESWFVPERVNAHILEHERTHFHITEIYARKLRKALAEMPIEGAIQRKIGKIYSQIQTEHNQTQQRFDKETKHSMETDKETEWRLWVQSRMEELKAWQ